MTQATYAMEKRGSSGFGKGGGAIYSSTLFVWSGLFVREFYA